MKTSTALLFFGSTAILILAAMLYLQGPAYYPYIAVQTPGNVGFVYLRQGRENSEECQFAAGTIANVISASCPTCKVVAQQCLTKLQSDQQKLLSEEPVSFPTTRLPDGVVAYTSDNKELAMAACEEAERQASRTLGKRVTCYPPYTSRSAPAAQSRQPINLRQSIISSLIFLLSAIASAFAGFLILRYDALHARWSYDYLDTGPQKFHVSPTPRIGGFGLLVGLLTAAAGMLSIQHQLRTEEFGYLLLASIPAFAGGIAEDLTKRVSIRSRLLLTMLAAAAGAWLLGAVLNRLDVPGVDSLLRWAPLAIAFTVFAVGGVANAINIIDGYNGLAGGYGILVLAALAWVSAQVGDTFLMTSALAMIGALGGFMIWNYPKGKIFLGDGGAYLLGFWLAELSVLLVARHPEVSPWFPMLLHAYPVAETFFSIYRKKFLRGHSPGYPDGLHFHMLIYKRLIRKFVGTKDARSMMRRNSMVATYIWAMTLCCAIPALVFWRQSGALALLTLLYCVLYAWVYRRVATWRTPRWMIRH